MKKNLSKVLTLILAFAMVLGVMTMGASAAFTDDEQIEYDEAVALLSGLGVINGYPDGSYAPKANFDRAGLAKMVAYFCWGGVDKSALYANAKVFDDLAGYGWAAGAINYGYNAKYINGQTANTYDPDGTVKGYELAKTLLCVMGYKADAKDAAYALTGSGWDLNAIRMAEAEGLFDGLINFDPTAALTREQAAQIFYNVIQNNTVYTSYNDDKTPDGVAKTTIMQRYFSGWNPQVGNGVDDYGRPAKTYTNAVTNKTVKVVASPVATYTTTVSADELYNKLGYNAVIDASTSYITNSITSSGSFLITVAGNRDAASADYSVSSKNMTIGGNGIVTEIYKNDVVGTTTQVEYSVVQICALPATVGTPVSTAATSTKGAYTTYPLTLATGGSLSLVDYTSVVNAALDKDNFTTDTALAKDAVVMVYGNETAGYTVSATKAVTGVLTSYNKDANQYVIGGATYNKASIFSTDITGNAGLNKVYYLDAYGYIAHAAEVAGVVPTYAVVTELALVKPTSTGAIGSDTAEYLEAEVVLFNGTKQIVKVEKVVDTAGTTTYTATGANGTTDVTDSNLSTVQALVKDDVVKYAVNDKGEYVLTQVDQSIDETGATLAATALFDGDSIANNATQFIVKTGSGTTVKYTAYTGYANLPTTAFTAGSVASTGVYAPNSSSVAGFVYLTGTDNTSSADGRTQAFVVGSGTYHYVSATEAYYEYNVIINGAATTLKVASIATQPTAGKMWQVDTLDAKGYVATMTDKSGDAVTITTAAKEGIIQLSTSWKDYNDSTVVYLIDATAGTVSNAAVTDLTSANTSSLYVTYVKTAAGADTAMIAQIIAVKA